jgi:mercuric ion transport protein
MKQLLEKSGTLGAVVSAAACPVCFPKLALVGAMLGLGVLAPLEGYFVSVLQVLVIAALVGQIIAYRRYRNPYLLGLAAIGTLCALVAYHLFFSELLVYTGLIALAAGSIWLVFESRRCPVCG